MRRTFSYFFCLFLLPLVICGCAGNSQGSPNSQNNQNQPKEQSLEDTRPQESSPKPPTVTEEDWSEYFEGINGAAVILKEAMLINKPETASAQGDEQNDSQTASDQAGEQNDSEAASSLIYGKTGMGKAHGVTVDCWFAGFLEDCGKRIYFCVYLGESGGADISSAKAKEIAIQLIQDGRGL